MTKNNLSMEEMAIIIIKNAEHKLTKWIDDLSKSGCNSKKKVKEEMKQVLKYLKEKK